MNFFCIHLWSYLWKCPKVELVGKTSFCRQVVNRKKLMTCYTRFVSFEHNFTELFTVSTWWCLKLASLFSCPRRCCKKCFTIKGTRQAFLTKNTNLFSVTSLTFPWAAKSLRNSVSSLFMSLYSANNSENQQDKVKNHCMGRQFFFSLVKIRFLFTHRGNWCQ